MCLEDYAIITGINLYPGLSSLQGPEIDAQMFASWVTDPNGGSVPSANVHTILTSHYHPPPPNSPLEADPNALRFRAALLNIITVPPRNHETHVGRRLYLYFAGHGFQGNSTWEEAVLYTANAVPIAPEYIQGTRYANMIKSAGLFKEIVLVMDCCRSVSLTGNISDPHLFLPPNPAVPVKRFYAYATSCGEVHAKL